MTASAVIRHGVACGLGLSAWWYFYSAGNIFYPAWVGVIVAAFIITLLVVIISNNIFAGFLIAILYFLLFSPGIFTAVGDALPVFGGTVAGIALWKIL